VPKTLEIKGDYFSAVLAGVANAPHQKRGFAGLAGCTDGDSGTPFRNLPFQMRVSLAFDVQLVAQRNCPTRHRQLFYKTRIELRQGGMQDVISRDGPSILRKNIFH
jgi:hypothetical protein